MGERDLKANKDTVKETQDDSLNTEKHQVKEDKDTVKETQDDSLNIEEHQDEENIESNEKQMHSENFNENRANSDISSLLGSEDSQQKNVSTEKPTNSNSTEIEKVAEAVANL